MCFQAHWGAAAGGPAPCRTLRGAKPKRRARATRRQHRSACACIASIGHGLVRVGAGGDSRGRPTSALLAEAALFSLCRCPGGLAFPVAYARCASQPGKQWHGCLPASSSATSGLCEPGPRRSGRAALPTSPCGASSALSPTGGRGTCVWGRTQPCPEVQLYSFTDWRGVPAQRLRGPVKAPAEEARGSFVSCASRGAAAAASHCLALASAAQRRSFRFLALAARPS